ncbi:MAG: autotransporter outer membrane beta-barrel domain-containing protein [Alphaproteobacteria bacterium]|nr:autotransporter outer membrane beta-barrel domain-containing protein [Alphaproteobacteria bacterium]
MLRFFALVLGLFVFEAGATEYEVVATDTVADGVIGFADRQIVHGTVNDFTIIGVQDVYDYGNVHNNIIYGSQNIYEGGAANNSIVRGGKQVLEGGVANNTILEYGNLYFNKGTANNVTIKRGKMTLLPSAQVNGLVATGGIAEVYEGGIMKGNINLDNAKLNVIGNNEFDNLNLNNSVVALMSENSESISVTINNLQGNGRFDIRTNLGANKKDLINIANGSGDFGLSVVDKSSSKEFPEQIDLLPNNAQNQENFYLVGGAVDVGARRYVLKEDDTRWYLQRTLGYSDTALIAKDIYATLGTLFYGHLQNIYARMGEFRSTPQSGFWVRSIGQNLRFRLGEKTKTNIDVYGAQLGADYLLNGNWFEYSKFGVSLGYTNSDYDFEFDGMGAGDTYSIALYSSLYNKTGLFVDMSAAYYWHKQKVRSHIPSGMAVYSNYDLNAYSLSAELGYRFVFGKGYFIEPQTQIYFMDVDDIRYTTTLATQINGKNQNSLLTRLGITLGKMWQNAEVYVSGDLIKEFDGKSKITVADWTFDEKIDGTFVRFGVGANMNINEKMSLYANASTMLGDNEVRIPIEGSFGLKWSF